MAIFKKEKPEMVALDLSNAANRKIAIQASLEHKIPLIYKGDGIFFMDTKHVKTKNTYDFLKQIVDKSETRLHGAIFREDPKCDYLVIYDSKED